jgi:hypothetical protein
VRRKRRKQEEQDAAAAAAPMPAPAGRRVVAAPAAPGAVPGTALPATTPGATPPGPTAAPAPTTPASMPDRVDALTEAIGGELGRLRGEMRGRDADLVKALQQVAESYDRVAARLDDERRVQALLAEALVRIDRRLASIEGSRAANPAIEGAGTPPREDTTRSQRVIGGSIAPRQDIPRLDR